MKFLVDNQLPLALAAYLRSRGDECQHVFEVGLDKTEDLQIWKRCIEEERVLISKDEDFIFLANRPGDTGRLIWVRLGNCRNAPLLDAFNRLYDAMLAALAAGQRIVELR
jgi:predicted nuclease of predicted toxin-antitoxin system